MHIILNSLILTALTITFEFIYIKFFDSSEWNSKVYILLALASLIPLLNVLTMLLCLVFVIMETIKLICGPGFDKLIFKLDTFRKKNGDIKIYKRIATENELELLKKYMIESKIFESKSEINDFLMSLKVCNKLEER